MRTFRTVVGVVVGGILVVGGLMWGEDPTSVLLGVMALVASISSDLEEGEVLTTVALWSLKVSYAVVILVGLIIASQFLAIGMGMLPMHMDYVIDFLTVGYLGSITFFQVARAVERFRSAAFGSKSN